ncbi:hypothetical protein Vretifemale_531 [Volvox reticuliferus]|uniref:Ubiquitin-like protease family profile domain-containing protein n=1 Tax=Volvox reticuliferus TaxID=1737510 RepID=A0A8J4FCP5_9CHLO|nr:hypothetical protein Vretifemale_531 [Volvox reticuliferus]
MCAAAIMLTLRCLELELLQHNNHRHHFFNTFFLKMLQEAPLKPYNDNDSRLMKWTKGVDIFPKDYIYVPIHGGIHWSLVLICHPSAIINQLLQPPVKKMAAGRALSKNGPDKPLMLHLDSLSGTHDPAPIFQKLRWYLEQEWKWRMNNAMEESVPRTWKNSFLAAGVQVPEVRFSKQMLPGISMASRLPQQDDSVDCGLFLLSYIDFFSAADPMYVLAAGGLDSTDVIVASPKPEAANPSTIMSKLWFSKQNTARLRSHMLVLMSKLMLGTLPAHDARYHRIKSAVEEYDKMLNIKGYRYLRPVEYLAFQTEQDAQETMCGGH